jgi:hypothetical protein
MKKIIINTMGIGSLLTLITMILMTVCFADEGNTSSDRPLSERNRIDRPGDKIKPQNVVANEETYSSSSNLSYVYESYGASSKAYDLTDYCEEELFETNGLRVQINNYEEAKAAEVIE